MIVQSLLWIFQHDDGYYFAETHLSGTFKVHPVTVMEGREPLTSFLISRWVPIGSGGVVRVEDIGECKTLENAKHVCELLENG